MTKPEHWADAPEMPRGVNRISNPFRRQKFELSPEAFAEFVKYRPTPEPPERIETTQAGRWLSTRAIRFLRESVEQRDARHQKTLVIAVSLAAILLLGTGALAFRFKAARRLPAAAHSAPSVPTPSGMVVPAAPPSTRPALSHPPLATEQPRNQRTRGTKSLVVTAPKPTHEPQNEVKTAEPDDFDISPFRH